MRFLSIDKVVPGTKLAKPVYSENGAIMLRENYILTNTMLGRLKELGYVGLYIDDEISKDIYIEEIVSEKLRLETASRLEAIMKKSGNVVDLMPNIRDIVDSVIANKDVISNMNRILGHHEYTYLHCVNVSIYSVLIGTRLNLTHTELYHLGTAGILHDIGKRFIPIEILDKPGKLTKEEFDIIKTHPAKGYEVLKGCRELTSTIKAGVLQHHERYDGTGYPMGLKAKEISKYGRILAIADTYDAMISERAYHKAYSPSEAIEYLMGNGNVLFDTNIVRKFLQCVAVYPLGSCVELSNQKTAIVVKNYSDSTLRPLVRLIEEPLMIDLKNDMNYLNVCITRIIE